ncbi:MAG: DNA gyrase inhibitor YacG [Candidatus Brocadia sp.]|nr:DNA gyrase inhibitor YacG [Candidatus Brocadia sp. AMX3]MDG5995536.1 DNA gyrase inhibitor YacG [Candidatus Brocadia sp.]OQZ02861.1 MAG: DNA gyrase inhibitor YacG [Candidatus Brocadia sp. UTAMX2]RIK02281.1 MAG: DNA gyrase inhibitor YacG [Candidatus Brocadia sp.]
MKGMRCPHCERMFFYRMVHDIPTFPFCSERCKLVDLGAWLDEKYRIEEPVSAEALKELEKKERREHG